MPFTKGNKLSVGNKGGGRKGYEYEQEQMKRMKIIFNKMLSLVEKIITNKATFQERIKYEELQKITLKIMDKLHANRQAVEISGELTEKVEVDSKELATYKKFRKQQKK